MLRCLRWGVIHVLALWWPVKAEFRRQVCGYREEDHLSSPAASVRGAGGALASTWQAFFQDEREERLDERARDGGRYEAD